MLFGIDSSNTNTRHSFRAVMGLSLAPVIFWVVGARKEALLVPAVWSLVVFMFGLAAGRAVSPVVDGLPHSLLLIYLILEVLFGVAVCGCYVRWSMKGSAEPVPNIPSIRLRNSAVHHVLVLILGAFVGKYLHPDKISESWRKASWNWEISSVDIGKPREIVRLGRLTLSKLYTISR